MLCLGVLYTAPLVIHFLIGLVNVGDVGELVDEGSTHVDVSRVFLDVRRRCMRRLQGLPAHGNDQRCAVGPREGGQDIRGLVGLELDRLGAASVSNSDGAVSVIVGGQFVLGVGLVGKLESEEWTLLLAALGPDGLGRAPRSGVFRVGLAGREGEPMVVGVMAEGETQLGIARNLVARHLMGQDGLRLGDRSGSGDGSAGEEGSREDGLGEEHLD